MPRVSEAEKSKSHTRILEAAARLLREQGFEATSVGNVMAEAGLTHGGFYRHFASKGDLAAAAFRYAVDTVVASLEQAESPKSRERALNDYLATYLSVAHVQDRGQGCPLAAMGGEVARYEGPLRTAAAEALRRMASLLDEGDRDDGRGLAIMSLLLGAVTLARVAETQDERLHVLSAGSAGVALLMRFWEGSDQGTSS